MFIFGRLLKKHYTEHYLGLLMLEHQVQDVIKHQLKTGQLVKANLNDYVRVYNPSLTVPGISSRGCATLHVRYDSVHDMIHYNVKAHIKEDCPLFWGGHKRLLKLCNYVQELFDKLDTQYDTDQPTPRVRSVKPRWVDYTLFGRVSKVSEVISGGKN